MKHILLTFDLEEFDLPLEFGQSISQKQMFEIPKQGLDNLLSLLDKYCISATFFTTATFAKKYPLLLKQISEKHEIACHGYEHSDSYSKDISKLKFAKNEIEKIIKKEITGFRAPRFEIKNIYLLSGLGFLYDSSIHPTFIPGRYMNLFKKRKAHKINNITEVPLSVLPILRLPIFWLAFKNLPLAYSKIFTQINFLSDNYTLLVFHPWEFADLSAINIPNYIKKKHGQELLDMLEKYIRFCKSRNYLFNTIEDFLSQ
ncbi:polysaccharide deacetylase family protein [Candidatus Pacearchaeota archaeon]|nr:polysaccharide deacetylase family protein [Candidatus Pacearchaeota archaeon]